LDLIGLLNSIAEAVVNIDTGRNGWAIKGMGQESRIPFEEGIALAVDTFQKVQISADPQALILAEYTYLSQELQLCSEADKDTLSSLLQAKQNFDWKAGQPRQYNKFPL
jgi:hypothetical protein